jgi:spore maturation protein CgeB
LKPLIRNGRGKGMPCNAAAAFQTGKAVRAAAGWDLRDTADSAARFAASHERTSESGRVVNQGAAVRPANESLDIVIIGLSITSSWGNGHATTYRCLTRELTARGHRVLFLERDTEWYASNRDLPNPSFCRAELYSSLGELKRRFASAVRRADCVIVGSYVPEGAAIGQWVTRVATGVKAFYDIDTPVTLARLEQGDADYLTRALIPYYDLYLSFTGGPTLDRLETIHGSPCAQALYCAVDADLYFPESRPTKWHLGYMGTYSQDRQPTVSQLLIEPANRWKVGRFVVAGPQFPRSILWPRNVKRIAHLSPAKHRAFYNSQRFTLNVTRAAMIEAGYSPSVRLFEAAACGTPIISDEWEGLEMFLKPGREIFIARSANDVLELLHDLPESERAEVGRRAREKVLANHTGKQRAAELETYILQVANTEVIEALR